MTLLTPLELTESQAIAHILTHCRTVAVVGLSPKVHRESYIVARYMQAHGWRIVPVNPVAAASATPILGETVYATLADAARHEKIDLVDVFRNSADVPPIAEEAIAIGAKVLWLQLGVQHDAAAARARAAGLQVVQDRCMLVEHQRLVAQGDLPKTAP